MSSPDVVKTLQRVSGVAYKYEIAMLREGAFHEDLKEKILEGNK